MIQNQRHENKCGLFYYLEKNLEVPRLITSDNPYGLSCKIFVFDKTYIYVIACFHYKNDFRSKKDETCFYLNKKEDCYFPIKLNFQNNKQKFTSINVSLLDLYQEMLTNENVNHKNFSTDENKMEQYERELHKYYEYVISDVENHEEIFIELSLCCFVLSNDINNLLKSYIGDFIVEGYYHINPMMNPMNVIDLQSLGNIRPNLQNTNSIVSFIISKSKKESHVDQLLRGKHQKEYECENYLDFAVRFNLKYFKINENLYQRNSFPQMNFIFVITTDIRIIYEQIVNLLMGIIQTFSGRKSFFSLIFYNNVTIDKQSNISENDLRRTIQEYYNKQFPNYQLPNSFEKVINLIDLIELNIVVLITDQFIIENNLNDLSTEINELKSEFNLLTSFIYINEINQNIEQLMSTINSYYVIINENSNVEYIRQTIINYFQPQQYITDVKISFFNQNFEDDIFINSIVSNIFIFKHKYKVRNIKDSLTLFALVSEKYIDDLSISVSFKYYSIRFNRTYKCNYNSIRLHNFNFLHHLIIKDSNCMSFKSWKYYRKPIQKSIYQYLLYQVSGNEYIVPITSKIQSDFIVNYVERTRLYNSVFPAVVVVMKYLSQKKQEVRLIPRCYMHVTFQEFRQKYIRQENKDNIIVKVNGYEKINDNSMLSSFNFKDGIKLFISTENI